MTGKKKIRIHERRALRRRLSIVVEELATTLEEDFDGRQLGRMTDNDRQRLYQLWIWKEKYKVSIRWILNLLLPIYHKRFARYTMNRRGLGVRIPTLVGRKSGQIVKENVGKEFPDEENFTQALQEQQEKIIERRLGSESDDGVVVRKKTFFDFPTPEAYARYYSRKMKNRRKELAHVIAQAQKTKKPYRGNPWL